VSEAFDSGYRSLLSVDSGTHKGEPAKGNPHGVLSRLKTNIPERVLGE